jgi:hypothetical protein
MAEAEHLVRAGLPYIIKLGAGIFHGNPNKQSKQHTCNARDVQTLKWQVLKVP